MNNLQEMLHYIISKDTHNKLGAVKLNKVSWFSDCIHFIEKGTSISKLEHYTKQQYGPYIPRFYDHIHELEKKKLIRSTPPRWEFSQTEYTALRINEGERFNNEQKEIITFVIDKIGNDFTAQEISGITHNRIWEIVDMGDKIPIYAFYAAQDYMLNDNDWKWVQKVTGK